MPRVARARWAPLLDRVHSRRGNSVFVRQSLLLDGRVPAATGTVDHGGNAVCQLQVVDVLERQRFRSNVRVQVDKPWHHCHAAGIDDAVGFRQRRTRRAPGNAVVADNLLDPVVLDDDVSRAVGRAAMARNDHRIDDRQTFVRSLPRARRVLCPCGNGTANAEHYREQNAELSKSNRHATPPLFRWIRFTVRKSHPVPDRRLGGQTRAKTCLSTRTRSACLSTRSVCPCPDVCACPHRPSCLSITGCVCLSTPTLSHNRGRERRSRPGLRPIREFLLSTRRPPRPRH